MGTWAAAGIQVAVLVALAPAVQGLIQRIKAALQGRHGPALLQPYFLLAKLWRRQELRPDTASPVFAHAPRAALAIVLAASLAVPLFGWSAPLDWGGGFIIVVGLLALQRYVISLAALDTGTPFAGLGSSRESTLGALVEPALFAVGLPWIALAGNTSWSAMVAASAHAAPGSVVRFFGLAAAVIVALAETGRLPVDNPDTHLELTMIHEAMLLEYSGPQLALMQMAQMVKQLLVFAVVADLLLPWGPAGAARPTGALPLLSALVAVAKWSLLGAGVAVAESLSTKLRFFRLPGYLGAAAALACAAAVLQVWGGR